MHQNHIGTRVLRERISHNAAHIAPILPGFAIWKVSMVIQITPKLYSVVPYNYHSRAILKMSVESAHNLFSNGWISDWAFSMVIWIATSV